ncbi:MAG: DNA polymerase III subunit alpha, partial [Hyphomicrobium sp.]
MSKDPKFVHLKVHSSYSLLEGALPISKLGMLAQINEFPAIALTDTNNLYGALEFSDKLHSCGIQPIIGVSLTLTFEDTNPRDVLQIRPDQKALTHCDDGSVTLIAINEVGYRNLMKIVTDAHLHSSVVGLPCASWSNICSNFKGIVLLTGGPNGPIDRQLSLGLIEIAQKRITLLKNVFGQNLYVEIQRHNLPEENENESRILKLAYDNAIPLVATNEVYFGSPDEHEAHDVLMCIAEGRYISEDGRRKVSREHYFKTSHEMASLFHDLPEALENSVEIAKKCTFRPIGRKPILPSFVSASKYKSLDDQSVAEAKEFKRQAEAGLRLRLSSTQLAPGFEEDHYWKRLDFEINVITKMNYSGYFLIVADFIKWSKAKKIPVGPGRGSGAGSLVAWALTITDLDPLRFGLLFERFLNPDRVSMPDFDIDFCQEKRDAVINYVQEKFGSERVAQIITHGKLQARAVLRDVGRVLQMPYPQVDRLCRLIPNNPASPVTLSQAIETEPKLQEARDQDPIVARLLQISEKLEGLYRHASTHAAGIVIADRPLIELVPLCRDATS